MAIIEGQIKCSDCREFKSLDSYQPSNRARGCGQCKSCKYVAKRNYEKQNRAKCNKSAKEYRTKRGIAWRRMVREKAHERNPQSRKHYSLARYGMGIEEYKKMFSEQGGSCAICRTKQNSDGKMLYVDHCHDTGTIRGLLCRKCNTGLGLLGDGMEGIMKAVNYLKRSQS